MTVLTPIRICHVITDLSTGGAQAMLARLVAALDGERFTSSVVALGTLEPMGERLRQLGAAPVSLGMRPGQPDPRAVARLARLFSSLQPDVVQTWLYHADLVGGLAAQLAGRPPVVWNIRHSNLDPAANSASTLLAAHACARLSRRLPHTILCNSQAAAALHAGIGYAEDKLVVIPNGFDAGRWRPDAAARAAVRRELGVDDATPLVGLVARFHPQKDHRTFALAAGRLAARRPDVRFVLIGEGATWQNATLVGWLREAGAAEAALLLGRRDDMPALTAALDVAVSSSLGESFANTLGEAMACGVPCVATNVGDSAALVGQTGVVTPPGDPAALARGMEMLLALGPAGRAVLGAAARRRMVDEYSIERVAARYAELYSRLAAPA